MDISNINVSNVINTLKEEIVSFGTPEGRENFERFIIPDGNGRKDNLFVRNTPLTAPMLIDYILRHNPLSTEISLYTFFDSIEKQPVTKSAFSQKRTRLDPEVFDYLNRKLISRSYAALGDKLRLWHGWHLIACDGSDIELPNTESLAEHFGRYRYVNNKGEKCESSTMAKIVMVNDIINGFTLWQRLCPYHTSERKVFENLLPEMETTAPFNLTDTICLLDRGYFSLKLIHKMDRMGMKYVVRVQDPGGTIRRFIASGKKEAVIKWTPSSHTSVRKDPDWIKDKRKHLIVRLVRVNLPNGEVEVLATNLSRDEVSYPMMKELYFMRWPIEVDYLHYKHAFEIESFSGGRPLCVMQDFYATVLAYNMVCLIEDAAKDDIDEQNRHKKLRYKTNVAILVGMFYAVFIDMMVLDKFDSSMDILNNTARKALTPIREGRSFPRVKIRRKSSDRHLTRTNRKRVC